MSASAMATAMSYRAKVTKYDEGVAHFHHGQEPCAPTKAEYICADPPVTSFFACDKAADHTFRLADDLGIIASVIMPAAL